MTSNELKLRTKDFALRIIKLIENLPKNSISKIIGNQLLRSATSVGANYRAACRSRSKIEFISRIKIVEEEADELTAIFTSTVKTSKNNSLNLKSKVKNLKSS